MVIEVNGVLLSHVDTQKVGRDVLPYLPVPPATDTFQPVPHNVLVDAIEESLAYRRIMIQRSEFAVSKDGMKCFGLLEVNHEYDGIRFAIGMRNSNDKSMRLAMVAGYRVFVCDNMSINGEFKPLLAKHTKGLDVIEAVSMGIDRIQRQWSPLREAIDRKRQTYLSQDEASLLIYKAFMEKNFPVSLIKTVHQDFFEKEPTIWNLENAFTEAFKRLQPLSQFEHTAKLGAYINSLP